MKKGFTMIELLVVIAMLLVLMGSVTSALVSARRRANIAKATTVCQEMTNAILAYENYAKGYSLETKATGDSWKEASRGDLGFILGDESLQQGAGSGKIPVLFNADFKGNVMLDPWNHPYRYRIKRASSQNVDDDLAGKTVETCVMFPNYNRRRAGEVR